MKKYYDIQKVLVCSPDPWFCRFSNHCLPSITGNDKESLIISAGVSIHLECALFSKPSMISCQICLQNLSGARKMRAKVLYPGRYWSVEAVQKPKSTIRSMSAPLISSINPWPSLIKEWHWVKQYYNELDPAFDLDQNRKIETRRREKTGQRMRWVEKTTGKIFDPRNNQTGQKRLMSKRRARGKKNKLNFGRC